MIAHVTAVACTLLIFTLLAASYVGWGRIAISALGIAKRSAESLVMQIWLGWAVTLLVFQLSHFFLPITAYIVIPVFLLGLAFAIGKIAGAFRILFLERPRLLPGALASLILFGFIAWVVSRAMLPPENYDSGLYHLNAIRWINTYPIVPGLGNLHARLAFNQSFFTYVAALNFYPFFGYGRSLANSFLLMLVFATLLPSLWTIIRQPSVLAHASASAYISALLITPIVAYLALSSNGVASPTPDLASSLLQLAMFAVLAEGLAEWAEGKREQDHRATVLTVLASTAVTLKLSNIAFSGVMVGISLAYVWRKSHRPLRGVVRLLAPITIIIIVWMIRGFILSGVPLFPSTIGYVPVSWAMPRDAIAAVSNETWAWARQPGAPWNTVVGNWSWLGPWSHRMIDLKIDVIYPLFLSLLFAISAAVLDFKNGSRPQYLNASMLIAPLVALIFWFFAAPDIRFASAFFFLLLVGSAGYLLSSLRRYLNSKQFLGAVFIVFMLANLHFLAYLFGHPYQIKQISRHGWQPVRAVPLVQKVTSRGLRVYLPESGFQCWDAPLPCTPYYYPDLGLRHPGELESGFIP